jgi:hypothetical protein
VSADLNVSTKTSGQEIADGYLLILAKIAATSGFLSASLARKTCRGSGVRLRNVSTIDLGNLGQPLALFLRGH